MRLPKAERSRVVLIGAAHYEDDELADLTSVAANVTDLKQRLIDNRYGAFDAVQTVLDPDYPFDIGPLLTQEAALAEDTFVVYYAGHGLVDQRGKLYLALRTTTRRHLDYTAMPFELIRRVFLDCPADNRVLLLDCCFSGRAIDAMADPSSVVSGQVDIRGTYTLTSSTANETSRAPTGARYTSFTGELLEVLTHGIPMGDELITLDDTYSHLVRALVARGLPEPQRRGTGSIGHLALCRNPAWSAPSRITDEKMSRESGGVGSMSPRLPLNEAVNGDDVIGKVIDGLDESENEVTLVLPESKVKHIRRPDLVRPASWGAVAWWLGLLLLSAGVPLILAYPLLAMSGALCLSAVAALPLAEYRDDDMRTSIRRFGGILGAAGSLCLILGLALGSGWLRWVIGPIQLCFSLGCWVVAYILSDDYSDFKKRRRHFENQHVLEVALAKEAWVVGDGKNLKHKELIKNLSQISGVRFFEVRGRGGYGNGLMVVKSTSSLLIKYLDWSPGDYEIHTGNLVIALDGVESPSFREQVSYWAHTAYSLNLRVELAAGLAADVKNQCVLILPQGSALRVEGLCVTESRNLKVHTDSKARYAKDFAIVVDDGSSRKIQEICQLWLEGAENVLNLAALMALKDAITERSV